MILVTPDIFPLAEVFTIARGSRTEAKVLTIRVIREGVTGFGECVPYARYGETLESVTKQITDLPSDISRQDLQDALPPGAARNAVDCALWDLEAKRTGTPVWRLAGLPKPKPEITAFTLSLDIPDKMQLAAAKHAHRPLLKIKLGTPDDMPRLEAVRLGAPNARIIVDANEGWTATLPRIFCASVLSWLSSLCPPDKTLFWLRLRVLCRFAPMKAAMTVPACPS